MNIWGHSSTRQVPLFYTITTPTKSQRKTMRLLLLISLILTLIQAEPRKALLIGNSKYTYIPNLDNPKIPMLSLKKALEGLGFDVVDKYNLNSENISVEVEKFADRLTTKSTAFFYYTVL